MNHTLATLPYMEHRRWGFHYLIKQTPEKLLKKLYIRPYEHTSYHKHRHRCESWFILSGRAFIIKAHQSFTLKTGDSSYIHAGIWHQIWNQTEEWLVLMELQTGKILSEQDVIRDAYISQSQRPDACP